MQHALYLINQTKGVFRDAWQIDIINCDSKTDHLNFLKWPVISYHPNWIKFYKSATGFTIGIEEAMHITWIKKFFERTNIRKSYEKQILDHNVKKFSLIVRVNLDMFFSTKILTQANQNAKL